MPRGIYIHRKIDPIKRIMKRIKEVNNSIGCWSINLCHSQGGYSYIRIEDKSRIVHRVLFEILIGKIPKNMELDHLCRNRWCQNPGHLEIVTRKENVRRGLCSISLTSYLTKCILCGKMFRTIPSYPHVFCSRKCHQIKQITDGPKTKFKKWRKL